MSRYSHIKRGDIDRALIVQEYGPDDVDALEYLAHHSTADDGRRPARDDDDALPDFADFELEGSA